MLFGLGFLLCDMLLAGLLIVLLVRGRRAVPAEAEAAAPLKGRWLWGCLVTAVVLLHLGLGVPFLLLLLATRR